MPFMFVCVQIFKQVKKKLVNFMCLYSFCNKKRTFFLKYGFRLEKFVVFFLIGFGLFVLFFLFNEEISR